MKKLLLAPLAALAITTTVFGGSYEYEYLEEVYVEDYEKNYEKNYEEETALSIGGGGFTTVALGSFFDPLFYELESNLERVLFSRFGSGFDVLIREGVSLEGNTVTYGDFDLELLKGITLKVDSFTSPNFYFDEELEEFFPDGEYRTEHVFQTFIAFRIGGLKVTEDFHFSGNTLILEEPESVRGFGSTSNAIFYDEETGYSYFLAQIHHFRDYIPEEIEIELNITHLLANPQHRIETIYLDIPSILENHSPTFEAPDEELENWRGNSWMIDLEEILGADFSLNEVYRLVRDELNIELGYENYLSNIALEGNLLHVQLRTPSLRFTTNFESMSNVNTWISLINTQIEEFDFSTINFDEIEDFQAFWETIPQRRLSHVYGIDNSDLKEMEEEFEGITHTFFREVGDIRHFEEVFLIEDLSALENLAFEISVSYFENIVELNLQTQPISLPVISSSIEAEESFEVNIDGVYYTFEDLTINYLGIRFDILDAAETLGNWDAPIDSRFDIMRLEVKFVLLDGSDVEFSIFSGGWGINGTVDYETGEWVQNTALSVNLGGPIIDVDNLAYVYINGALVSLR